MAEAEFRAGESLSWWRYDGGDVPSRQWGEVWSKAPVFKGMRGWWVQNDEGMHYVTRASREYTTGLVVDEKWRKDGDVIEVGTLFEETHPASNMAKFLAAQRQKAQKSKVTHDGRTKVDHFAKLCESQ